MPNDCLPQVQVCAMRVARLDNNGVPLPGASNLYVSDALAELTATPVYTDGEEIEERNACGAVVVNYRGDDSFRRLDISLRLITPDPELSEMLAGDRLVSGGRVGWAAPPLGEVTGAGVSLELYSKRIDDGDLAIGDPYAWWVLPKVKNLRAGDLTFGNAAIPMLFSGQAVENPNWFNGPLNDWPVASDRVIQWIPWNALPDVQCGYVELAAS